MATDGELNETSSLLDELRAEGEVDSLGRFTLDRAEARAKLQKFQLADARRYVLELVQAAVLRGATKIAFDIDADDMRMRFDGRVFTPAELDDLWGSIFADGDGEDLRGLRQLALGLNAALGTAPKRIIVRSGPTQVRMQPGREDEITTIDPAITETTIHVEQRLTLVLVVEFLRDLTGLLSEELYLRERCRYSAIPITLDGRSITEGLTIADAIVSQSVEGPGLRGVIGLLPLNRTDKAELRLVKDGVWIDSHALDKCGPGLVAVVVGERLRKDVSLAKIVADDALSQIVGLVGVERWGLFAQLVAQVESRQRDIEPTMGRVRAESMEFMKLRLIRKRPDVQAIARALVFPDARKSLPPEGLPTRWITLFELAEQLPVAGGTKGEPAELRYAYLDYAMLAPEGAPIPKLGENVAKALAKVLACKMVRVDEELDRATNRERARKAWLARTMEAKLPGHRRYLLRVPLELSGLSGEVGIELPGTAPRTDGTIWLLREGCLLTKLEVAWGIPGLDVVVDGDFVATDQYDDVVRDRTLARVCLHVVARLAIPLAELVARMRGGRSEAVARVFVEAWLMLVLDPAARLNLLSRRLGILESEHDAELAAKLPTPEQVRTGAGPLAAFLDLALFQDFDGTPRSLRELSERLARVGALDELDRGVLQVPGLGREVVWLDQSNRWILAGLFGESALRSWGPTLDAKRREQAFWAKPQQDFAAVAQAMRNELQIAGVDPALWSRTIEAPGVRAMITLGYGIELGRTSVDPELLRGAKIELMIEGRMLATRVLDLGIGPIVGVASDASLRVRPDWSDVEDDDELLALTELLREAAWTLVTGLVRRFDQLFRERQWLATMLLHRLAQSDGESVAVRLPTLPSLPLLDTIDGSSLSLLELDAVIREHGRIEWVDASTPGAGIRNPPMLREEPLIIDALGKLVGVDKLAEGGDRLRRHGLSVRLEGMPKVDRFELEPRSVWFVVAFGQPARAGEIGLSRVRTSGGLSLELCTLGRRVGVVTSDELAIPVEAILDDPELPLLGDGTVDTRSKRYGQYLRRCRRAVPGLVVELCKRFADMTQADRERARVLLLGHAQAEAAAGPGRREARETAWEAVRALPLFVDVWGKQHSLATLEARAKARGELDVVSGQVDVEGLGPDLDRLIVIVDPPARRCLATSMKLRDLDASWAQERAAMRELAGAPEFQMPDLRAAAWVDRKATVAGGLEAHLWIPRTPSESDVLVFTRGRKVIGRLALIPGVPCAGVVYGDGLDVGEQGIELNGRQRPSLAKQICVLYQALAKQVESGGRLNANEREQALAWLVGVDAALRREGDPLLEGIGKPLEQLLEALDGIISPALRRSMARARKAEQAKPAESVRVEPPKPAVVAAPAQPVQRQPVTPPVTEPVASEAAPIDPEVLLLDSLRAELEWARTRHGATLDRLGLDRLRIGSGKPGIAVFERGIVLQRQHPLVARQLAALAQGQDVDPIDLAFLVSSVFTLINAVADEIDATDERAFVGHMAETLALARLGS
jgi:hypothetical protein